MSRRAEHGIAVLVVLAMIACTAPPPPSRAATESELEAFVDLAERFRCDRDSWPASVSEMREFAAQEGVSLDWEPFEEARFSAADAQVLEVSVHPSALPPQRRLTISPEPSVPSTLTSTIRLKPSSCVTAAKPALPEGACEPVSPGQIDPSDVAIVIDSSASTSAPSGLDVNRNGTTGWGELNVADPTGTLRPGRFFGRIEASDLGDSVLAHQVAAARSLVEHAAQADVRFAVISHSDVQPKKEGRRNRRSRGRPDDKGGVMTRNGLTRNGSTLGSSLDQVLEHGSAGGSSFSAAMMAANAALLEPGDDLGARRRLVVFISDNPLSTSDSAMGEAHRADPDMKTAAEVAIEAKIVFHTFGLGRAAATPPPHALSRIAGATGGRYRSIDLGSDFSCELTRALAARIRSREDSWVHSHRATRTRPTAAPPKRLNHNVLKSSSRAPSASTLR